MFNFSKCLFTIIMVVALTLTAGAIYLNETLPDVEELADVQLQIPLKVYTRDGKLISQFGEFRRDPATLDNVPPDLIHAFLATEDRRFYDHAGVDFIGLTRAAHHVITQGNRGQGGSTITMQVARNYYLSPQKTYVRKLNEILLALKIEREFDKDEILELYLNKIYLGNRAYGIVAAAQVYYGKNLDELTLAEKAMIAGLPQAPSRVNPLRNPEAAKARRKHVLDRMLGEGFIDEAAYNEAVNAPITATYHGPRVEVKAPYAAEMVRQQLYAHMGDDIYTKGYHVYTTLDSTQQNAANAALEAGLMAYDRRHGYRGPVETLSGNPENDLPTWLAHLRELPTSSPLIPAVVTGITSQTATVTFANEQTATLPWSSLSWARSDLGERRMGAYPQTPSDIFNVGALIYVIPTSDDQYRLAQVPLVQGALIAMNPESGAITAVTGGFDFYRNNFNMATQAKRQPGSSFKPFIYAAALAKGFTTASIINDAPIVFQDVSQESLWRPQNDNQRFAGPTRLRMGLIRSRNLVSIRLLDAIGIEEATEYVSRFGFNAQDLPQGLSMALGTTEVSPLQMVQSFSVFANGGYLVTPHVIEYLTNEDNQVIMRSQYTLACAHCSSEVFAADHIKAAPQVIPSQDAYIMVDLLKDVIKRGTGRGALVLERDDIGGKTGTTNDQKDGWFVGFNGNVAAAAWIGYDRNRSLAEYAAQTALPIWTDFMGEALKDTPEYSLPQPPGLVHVRIDPQTGLLAHSGDTQAEFEVFKTETAPQYMAADRDNFVADENTLLTPEQLF